MLPPQCETEWWGGYVLAAPPAPVCFSSPYLPLPSLPIEFVRWFKSTGIPTGYAQLVQESFCGNGGCTYEVAHTYLYELERISSPVSSCRTTAAMSGNSHDKGAQHQMASSIIVQQPGYPQR